MPSPSSHAKIPPWRVFDYMEGGTNKVEQWLMGNPRLRARLHSHLAYLGGLRRDQWEHKYYFAWLEGEPYEAAELGEIRFDCDGAAQRPVGTFGIESDRFILLMGCCKRGNRYFPSPPHPFDVAVTRKERYLADPSSIEERITT